MSNKYLESIKESNESGTSASTQFQPAPDKAVVTSSGFVPTVTAGLSLAGFDPNASEDDWTDSLIQYLSQKKVIVRDYKLKK